MSQSGEQEPSRSFTVAGPSETTLQPSEPTRPDHDSDSHTVAEYDDHTHDSTNSTASVHSSWRVHGSPALSLNPIDTLAGGSRPDTATDSIATAADSNFGHPFAPVPSDENPSRLEQGLSTHENWETETAVDFIREPREPREPRAQVEPREHREHREDTGSGVLAASTRADEAVWTAQHIPCECSMCCKLTTAAAVVMGVFVVLPIVWNLSQEGKLRRRDE